MSKRKTTEQFIKEAKLKHGDLYDYSKVKYINNSFKVEIICPKHGSFKQAPVSHLRGHGCVLCASEKGNAIFVKNNRKSLEQFIKEARLKHGDKYDYSKAEYINGKTKVEIICPKHGSFKQAPVNHLSGQGCPLCNESHGEKLIFKILDNNNINFEREKTFSGCINPKTGRLLRFDFYLPNYNICIEYDGKQHFKNCFNFDLKKTKYRDQLKNEFCEINDIRLIRISYLERENIYEILVNLLMT